MNGIDDDGAEPPDELVFDGDSSRVELLHSGGSAEWELRVYQPDGGYHTHFYGEFEDAFAQFAAHVAAAGEVTGHV